MSGVPLCQLEARFLGRPDRLGHCEHARHFALRIVPDLAFFAGLPARLLIARSRAVGEDGAITTTLATLGSAVREGCESPEALATKINCGRDVSRVAARGVFDQIISHAVPGSPTEDFEETRRRMSLAEDVWLFSALN